MKRGIEVRYKEKPKLTEKTIRTPKEFKQYGYTFVLYKQSGRIALYTQEKEKKVFGYEVHVLSPRPPYTQPKSKFGRYAWSFTSLKDAERKFNDLAGWDFVIQR